MEVEVLVELLCLMSRVWRTVPLWVFEEPLGGSSCVAMKRSSRGIGCRRCMLVFSLTAIVKWVMENTPVDRPCTGRPCSSA